MLPSQQASAQAAQTRVRLSAYTPEIVQQVSTITQRLLALGFAGVFSHMNEGPVVRTFYFSPEGSSKYGAVLNKAEEIAGALKVESVLIDRELGDLTIAVPRSDRQT